MLASSLREKTQATVSNKPGHRGEREVSRKPLRAGMPGYSGGPVVTNSCVCFHYTRGCGCIDTRHSPRPRFFQGDRLTHTSGASRRENAEVCPKDERATLSSSSPRKRGPITTVVCWRRSRQPLCQKRGRGVWVPACAGTTFNRHCEERSDEAIHSFFVRQDGLLRSARNDGLAWLFENRIGSFVVPAKAGTHTPRPLCVNGWLTALFVTNAGGYGSLLSQGRQ